MAMRQRVRWIYVITISLVGLAFISAPFYLARKVDADFGADHTLISSTLTNVGTSIVLVAIVFFLERALLQRVSDTAAETTARVVDERTTDLSNANQALATELADLRAEFEGAVAADIAARTAPLRTVSADVSFDSVAEALETANSYGALEYGTATVPLKSPSDHPELVTFDWRYHPVRDHDGYPSDTRMSPQMVVSYNATRNPGPGSGTPVVEVVWGPEQAPTELLMALRAEMVKRNFGREAKLVDPDLFEHLAKALAEAVAGRMAEESAWVVGALDEWLAEGWAITDAGLVSRGYGKIDQNDFPKAETWGGSTFNQKLPKFEPPAPDGVSEEFWRYAVRRAAQKFGNRHPGFVSAYTGSQYQQPFSTENSPRSDPRWKY